MKANERSRQRDRRSHDYGTPRFYDLRAGKLRLVGVPSWGRPVPDLSDVLAERHFNKPWLLYINEPLPTKAPGPSRCQPHCCYINTVIFYHRPYISAPGRWSRWRDGRLHRDDKVFVTYDQVEARLRWDDVVAFDGDEFDIGGGEVRWHHQCWWVHRVARRRRGA